jgi:hypothetical protein
MNFYYNFDGILKNTFSRAKNLLHYTMSATICYVTSVHMLRLYFYRVRLKE